MFERHVALTFLFLNVDRGEDLILDLELVESKRIYSELQPSCRDSAPTTLVQPLFRPPTLLH